MKTFEKDHKGEDTKMTKGGISMSNNAKVGLTGRLTREPKQSTVNGSTVVSFSVAVNTTKKDGDNYVADFYNVSVWGKPAEFVLPRIQKGSLVQVYGDQYQDSYTDKNGVQRQGISVRATEVIPLTPVKKTQTDQTNESDPF